MAMYESFARVYDTFMDNVPYDEWCEYLTGLLKEDGIEEGLILDLGCGTGSVTERLAKAGYDMIGVDNALEMLEIAQEKKAESGLDILYLLQDMREFELYGTVKAVVSLCDSVNYLTCEEDLLDTFRLVNNYLDPGGLFIFDLNTIHKYRDLIGDATIAEKREDCSFIWYNSWYEEEKINEYDLTLFLKQEDGTYSRFDEVHDQCAFPLETVGRLLEEAGLRLEHVYRAFTKEAGSEDDERVYFIAREVTKTAQT